MSRWMYVAQVLVIAPVLYILVWRQHKLLRIQVIAWAIGVIGIWWRYGESQEGFYSNDQRQYASSVRVLMQEELPRSLNWWIEYSKIPYPLSALPLALSGIHIQLALKTVSLICLLLLTRTILEQNNVRCFRDQLKVLYFTGCGLIGTFFSLLALRETMMMLFVYTYTMSRSLPHRLISLCIIFLLRSHLAAALVVAELALYVWRLIIKSRRIGFVEPLAIAILGLSLGTMLFWWRFAGFKRIQTPFSGSWGIAETYQVASNYAGLQFLTSHEAFVRLSISELFGLRLIFSDTVLIPLVFTLACILLGPRLRERHKFTLLAFSIYVSIVTNTDFNSFRQNIPFMPLMGMVVLDMLDERRLARRLSKEVGRAVENQYSEL